MKNHFIKNRHYSIEFSAYGIPHLVRLGKVEYSSNTRTALELHIHPNQFEICFHYDGQQYYEVENEGFITKSGDIFITYPNERHSTGTHGEEKSKLFYFIFELLPNTTNFMGLESELSDYIRDTLYQNTRRQLHGSPVMKEILQQIFDLHDDVHPFQKIRIYQCLVEFFYLLTECFVQDTPTTLLISPDIARAIQMIRTDPAQRLSVAQMADAAGLSVPHFKRKFKESTGLSPYDFLLRDKISLAKEMLLQTNSSIIEISLDLGFSSSQHFAATFKRFVGKTPTQYRRGEMVDPMGKASVFVP